MSLDRFEAHDDEEVLPAVLANETVGLLTTWGQEPSAKATPQEAKERVLFRHGGGLEIHASAERDPPRGLAVGALVEVRSAWHPRRSDLDGTHRSTRFPPLAAHVEVLRLLGRGDRKTRLRSSVVDRHTDTYKFEVGKSSGKSVESFPKTRL